MVDLDKFICSFISYKADEETMKELREFGADLQTAQAALTVVARSIKKALAEQGLEYKDGVIKPIEKEGKPVIIDAGFGSLTVHFNKEEMEAFEEGLKKKPEAEKPSTIKFDEPDIEEMVEEYKRKMGYNYYLFAGRYEVDSYKQGLEDMYRKIKGE